MGICDNVTIQHESLRKSRLSCVGASQVAAIIVLSKDCGSMLGSQLDGLHIKEADKVPRRSLTFKQASNKRARVEETAPVVVNLQCATDNLELCIPPPVIPVATSETASPPQLAPLVDNNFIGVAKQSAVHPTSQSADKGLLSLVQAKKWAELKQLCKLSIKIPFDVVYALIQAGQVDLLVYARRNGCFKCKTKLLIKKAIKSNCSPELVNELNEKLRLDQPWDGISVPLCDLSMKEALDRWVEALQNDNLQLLTKLRKKNCPWDCTVCEKAVRYGLYEALEYLLQEGCPMGNKLYTLIIERELWKFLPLIAKHGYKLDPKIRFEFARHGMLEALRATVECGMKMVSEVCVLAALNGHLDCLSFAHAQGAKIEQKVCLGAVQQGHLSCVQYALAQGCTMTKTLASQAVKFKHMHILKYLHEQGCPMDKVTSKLTEALPVPAAVELDINS